MNHTSTPPPKTVRGICPRCNSRLPMTMLTPGAAGEHYCRNEAACAKRQRQNDAAKSAKPAKAKP